MTESIMRLAGTSQRHLSNRIGFTIAILERTTCPPGKGRIWAYDARTPGLAFMVTESGAKAGETLLVHLPALAVDVLQKREENKSEWVFPSHSQSGHLQEPKKAWAALLVRAGLSGLRIHDWRRTMGSWQAATGASLPVIGKSLGHKNVSTTAIYARLNLDPVKESVNKATAAMMVAAKAKPKKPRKVKKAELNKEQ